MKKRLASLFLALALCLGLCVPALAFSDVPGDHYAYAAIMDCSERGIVGGYGDGTFRPGNTVSKGQFCAMMARAFYPDEIAQYDKVFYRETYGTFGPVVELLLEKKLLEGTSFRRWQYSNSTLGTGISRYDMALIMTNVLTHKGFSVRGSDRDAAAAKITDYGNVPEQYRAAVASVYALGMIGGYSDGTFGGEGVMNRGQAAAVIYRMIQLCGNAPETPPETEKPGTGGPETPETPETAEKPETPVQSDGRTLANGQPITEENVTAVLEQLKDRYPRKTDFSKGYAGLNSGRTPAKNCIAQITNQYWRAENHSHHTSTTIGCDGWAAFVADEIWGQTGVTWRKTTIANARPGDLMIQLDNTGYLMHVCIYVSNTTDARQVSITDAGTVSGVYKILWGNSVAHNTQPVEIWTAYPN